MCLFLIAKKHGRLIPKTKVKLGFQIRDVIAKLTLAKLLLQENSE